MAYQIAQLQEERILVALVINDPSHTLESTMGELLKSTTECSHLTERASSLTGMLTGGGRRTVEPRTRVPGRLKRQLTQRGDTSKAPTGPRGSNAQMAVSRIGSAILLLNSLPLAEFQQRKSLQLSRGSGAASSRRIPVTRAATRMAKAAIKKQSVTAPFDEY